jgi:hypothetical protein
LTYIIRSGIYHCVVFVESRPFTLRLTHLAAASADEVLSGIQGELLRNPERGRLVQGTGGVRKARAANPARQKGTRGGFRYFFLYLERKQHIHLLALLDKSEQEDISKDERKALKALVDQVKKA